MASKYDLTSIVARVQKSLKDDRLKKSVKMGTEMAIVSKNPDDYVVLPEALGWSRATGGLLGLPFGKLVQIAGVSDSGKTSFAVTAMRAAQEQNVPVLFVETELKTSKTDLEAWGVDCNNVMLVQSSVSEEAFSLMFECWDAFFDANPGAKLLVIIDSWGNTISMRDESLDLTTQNIQPGGAAKTNRLSVNKMISKLQTDRAALLISNYSYANLGSVGETAAGGRAIHFFTYVGFFTKRVKDLTKTIKGEKVKTGVQVRWRAFKNHAAKGSEVNIPHSVDFEIDAKGMRMVGVNSDDAGNED